MREGVEALPQERFVLQTDVKSSDAALEPQRLLDRLAVHSTDGAVLNVSGESLRRCGTERGGLCREQRQGMALGSPLRPILGAFFLTEVDAALEKHGLFVSFR